MERDELGSSTRGAGESLGDAIRQSQARMADRLRSPWWFHALYGLAIGCMVLGLAERTAWGAAVFILGLAGEIAASRWRAGRAGFSRANPSRFTFLRSGAPWSMITFGVFAAALATGVFDRGLSVAWLVTMAAVAGLAATALGPLADRSARRHLARVTP